LYAHARALHAQRQLHTPPPHARSHCLSFFFNDTATTEIYTLSLHDALPILYEEGFVRVCVCVCVLSVCAGQIGRAHVELQSHLNLVCRLLLEKKKTAETAGRRHVLVAYTSMLVSHSSWS